MRLENIIIGVILLSLVVLGFSAFIGDVSNNYGVSNAEIGFNASFDKIDIMTNKTEALRETVQGDKLVSVTEISSGAFSAVSLIWDSFDIFATLVKEAALEWGLPIWFIQGIIAIVVVIIAFSLINYIFRYEPK